MLLRLFSPLLLPRQIYPSFFSSLFSSSFIFSFLYLSPSHLFSFVFLRDTIRYDRYRTISCTMQDRRTFLSFAHEENFKFLSEQKERKDHFSSRFQSYIPMILSIISSIRVKSRGISSQKLSKRIIFASKEEREKRGANFVVVAKCSLFERKLSFDERIGRFV